MDACMQPAILPDHAVANWLDCCRGCCWEQCKQAPRTCHEENEKKRRGMIQYSSMGHMAMQTVTHVLSLAV